ncbi:MAG TPA: reverse transcriptase domain-containing protein, partial [Blastocatellia bacterium]|nr:reverse transcriptase domain-containing protein [Blastocatellia bacterium]
IDAAPLQVLTEIQRALQQNAYQFQKKLGYTKRKSGGSRRGITIHAVRDRIVQRAILNLLHSTDAGLKRRLGDIPEVLHSPRSFAGVQGRGVPEAVANIVELIRRGAGSYVYSDMKDFFPRIPRREVIEFIRTNVQDDQFAALFGQALETELSNEEELRQMLSLFPGPEIGIAQGSLLSVLAGNIVMRRFDDVLNADGLAMVRYLDDFVILTADVAAAENAFDLARAELGRLGMDCYAPGDGSQKAFIGRVADGFDFLGCRIHPDGVSPSRKNQRKLLRDVQTMIRDAKREILAFKQDDARRRRTEATYLQTLNQLDRKLRGWGDVYQFVSNRVSFSQMDEAVDRMLEEFRLWFARQTKDGGSRVRRRMTGIALLADTPPRKDRG